MSRWLARWRAALRIARRDAWRNKGRTVLVVLLMMLPVAAGTFAVGVLKSSMPTTETRIAWAMGETAEARLDLPCGGVRTPTQQNIWGDGFCSDGGDDLGELPLDDLEAALPTGAAATPAGEAVLRLRTDSVLLEASPVVQVDGAAVPGLLGQVSGEPVPGAGQAVLREQVAQRLGVHLGDTVELLADDAGVITVDVVGIGDTTSSTAALLGPGTLPDGVAEPAWFVTGDVPVTWGDVVTLNELGLSVTSRAVLTDPPPPDQVYGGLFRQPGVGLDSFGFVLAVGGLVLIEIILLIGPAFAVGAKRSARALALVAASGGEPADLRRIVLAGGVVAGVVAAAAGVLIGTAATVVLGLVVADLPNLRIPVLEPLAIGLVALVLGVAAAWIPARTASRSDVVTVLAGRHAERPVRRRVAWIGLGMGAVGVALSVVAAVASQVLLLAAGVVVLELGLVIASGALVALAGRLAGRFGVAGRFALRDAHRHRSRTAPAVAAVLAVVAGATAALVYLSSGAATQENIWQPVATGTGLLSLNEWSSSPQDLAEQYPQAAEIVEDALPGAMVTAVSSLTWTGSGGGPMPSAQPDPATVCPDENRQGPDAEDERCRTDPSVSAGFSWTYTIVDDGTLVDTLGLDGADEAARALADGQVLVNDPDAVWPDGNAHIALLGDGPDPVAAEVLAPAHLVDWSSHQYGLVLSPQVADQVTAAGAELAGDSDGFVVVPVGATVTGADLPQSEVDQINRQLSEIEPNIHLDVEGRMNGQDTGLTLVILVGVALFGALAATGLSVGLAVADSRADLTTLAAIGASPRVRRRITAAQAGVIATIGTVTGVVTGLLLGYVLGLWQGTDQNYGISWQTVVPWPHVALLLVGLPLAAMGAGWLLTRSRLPVRRRAMS